jgi:hypothetical protein
MNTVALYDSIPTENLRERVIDDLVKHYSQERIDLAEFERRTDLASKASSRGELIAQVADLPSLAGEAHGALPRARTSPEGWGVAEKPARQNDFAVAIFGGSDFRGVWRAPRRLSALAVFGGSTIDLRRAIVPAEGMTISCICAFGGVDVVAPRGMRVQTRGMGVFGGFDRADNEPDDPDAPTITIEGIAVFGGVSVKIKD